ncbi:hypothetical protein [Agromyces sp. SYSU T00194]|uniref:hypothetical protein n=1 Tax=Agromyces chitinivorans TaxID=3158560 RepID=UPI003398DA24
MAQITPPPDQAFDASDVRILTPDVPAEEAAAAAAVVAAAIRAEQAERHARPVSARAEWSHPRHRLRGPVVAEPGGWHAFRG